MTVSEPRVQSQVGPLLREWRERRRLSQLELALQAGVSARHVSFLETGRAKPSRAMVLRLAEQLDVPMRDRNPLLLAAGYAPVYAETPLAEPVMSPVLDAVRQILHGHDPYPALVVDGDWNLVDTNASFALFTEGVSAELLEPPVNALRLVLHPDGMAPRIINHGVWRAKLLGRLRRRAAADIRLRPLYEELLEYPCEQDEPEVDVPGAGDICIPLQLRRGDLELSFFGTLATFGTPRDITVAELVIESFFPADAQTAEAVRAMGGHYLGRN
ncbi:transcriptional regulator with XRE-family HTH domain [Kitasatospora sp. MAA4]|uniref:helix-turn-helix domain-containing protein n=1 Tax=Kitasatospora sp. MAA4 TaxID=3035093 RepID=UPI002474D945|nr:helix-turn-helix transcriptional regulator [Kitasatospora sp. MAA4]MDH6135467.1 transcriptional regulator with XRE-family HTH domain [Kitasatospora sp. MAA4]